MMGQQHGSKLRGLITLAGALVVLVMSMSSSSNATEHLSVEYLFEIPQVSEIVIGDVTYHRLSMNNASTAGNPGQPALPSRGARILLPPGTEVESIEIVPGERILLGRDYLVEPVGQSYPLSSDPAEWRLPAPDAAIYQSDAVFPSQHFQNIGTQNFRGYRIVTLKLQPVEYFPVNGELYYYSRLTAVVHLRESDAPAVLLRGLAGDVAELETRVDNVELARTATPVPRLLTDSYDLLIITTPELASSFQPLKAYHDTTGIPTEIHTIADIGNNHPDAVRDYIRERYLNDGIEYVLIGGDDDIIPAKDLYLSCGGYTENDMPGDIYFACLDGTYDYNGNNRCGEPDDGEGGGEVDLIAEVYVGRASVDDAVEVNHFVHKTIQRLASQDPYLNTVLLVGENLGLDGPPQYAGYVMDALLGGSASDPDALVGIPLSMYSVTKLYDRDWIDNDWPASEVINRINSGPHIVNHLGHGWSNWAMKMYSSAAVGSFTNSEPCFIYSQACLSGKFDGDDCWAEYVNVKTNYAAYAVIMNARFGFASITTDGSSQRYNRQFWDAIFNPYDYHPQIGRANQDSKEDLIPWINDGVMRWCCYEINLFGDPTIAIDYGQAQVALTFDYPAGLPDTVRPNQQTTFEVDVLGYYGGVSVPGSGELHYRINGGLVQSIPMDEIAPGQYEATLPAVTCEDTLEYFISADEVTTGRFYDPEPESFRRPMVNSEVVPVLVDDFHADLGWTTHGDAVDGQWNRGIPMGMGDRGDPVTDYDDNCLCYLTGSQDGDSDVEGGTTYLETPVFDLSADDGVIRYARWYCNDVGDNPHEDVFVVSISNDNGANWTTVEIVGPEDDVSGGWSTHWFWAGDFITLTDQMKVQFAASDLGGESIVEAAVDAFSVTQYNCYNCDCPDYCDLDASGAINPVDVVHIVNFVYKSLDARIQSSAMCPGENGDWNIDGEINPIDVVFYVNYVYKSTGTGPDDPCY